MRLIGMARRNCHHSNAGGFNAAALMAELSSHAKDGLLGFGDDGYDRDATLRRWEAGTEDPSTPARHLENPYARQRRVRPLEAALADYPELLQTLQRMHPYFILLNQPGTVPIGTSDRLFGICMGLFGNVLRLSEATCSDSDSYRQLSAYAAMPNTHNRVGIAHALDGMQHVKALIEVVLKPVLTEQQYAMLCCELGAVRFCLLMAYCTISQLSHKDVHDRLPHGAALLSTVAYYVRQAEPASNSEVRYVIELFQNTIVECRQSTGHDIPDSWLAALHQEAPDDQLHRRINRLSRQLIDTATVCCPELLIEFTCIRALVKRMLQRRNTQRKWANRLASPPPTEGIPEL